MALRARFRTNTTLLKTTPSPMNVSSKPSPTVLRLLPDEHDSVSDGYIFQCSGTNTRPWKLKTPSSAHLITRGFSALAQIRFQQG